MTSRASFTRPYWEDDDSEEEDFSNDESDSEGGARGPGKRPNAKAVPHNPKP